MTDWTDITILLDRSGSMAAIQDDVRGGLRTFIQDQQRLGSNASLSLVQFDSQSIDTVYDARPIEDVPAQVAFQPRGGTPLLDALGQTLVRTGERLAATGSACPDKVVFVILTDGQENASREYDKARIKTMVEHQHAVYNWQFVYLGANQDAFAEAGGLGISLTSTADVSPRRFQYAVGATSASVGSYRSTGNSGSLNWTDQQRHDLTNEA